MGNSNVSEDILVVDDNLINLVMLEKILTDEGFRVRAVSSGEKAIAEARRMTPDLILLDINMPDMDGYEVCTKMQSMDLLQAVPIIFISALTETTDIVKAFESGGVDYVTKPLRIEEVLARVRTHLDLKYAKEELAKRNEILVENMCLREDVERMSKHDLKSPLAVIFAYCQMLLETDDISQENIKKGIRTIYDAGQSILGMVDMSLDLLKMEKGIYEFAPTVVDVVVVATEVMGLMKVSAKYKEVSCNLVLQSDNNPDDFSFGIIGEELLIFSMLSNLIGNSIEASPQGHSVTMTLKTEPTYTIRIHNHGAVPEDMRERFFDKYATSGKSKGTGLGTYSAKLIAQTFGGAISLDTPKQNETEITIAFPSAFKVAVRGRVSALRHGRRRPEQHGQR